MDFGTGYDFAKNVGSQTRAPGTAGSGPDTPLWRAIRDFPLDDPDASMPFSVRLARDHLWTGSYTAAVIAEYRRFLYLLATEPEMVTPSEDVDETWHLHLAYTKSYWDEFCGKVIGRPLHHNPTGGDEDSDGFRGAYDNTLRRYRFVFNEAPLSEVWPSSADRFALAGGFRTVPLRDFCLLGRKWEQSDANASWYLAIAYVLAVGAILAFLAGLTWTLALGVLAAALPTLHAGRLHANSVVLPSWGAKGTGFSKYQADPQKGGSSGCAGCG